MLPHNDEFVMTRVDEVYVRAQVGVGGDLLHLLETAVDVADGFPGRRRHVVHVRHQRGRKCDDFA